MSVLFIYIFLIRINSYSGLLTSFFPFIVWSLVIILVDNHISQTQETFTIFNENIQLCKLFPNSHSVCDQCVHLTMSYSEPLDSKCNLIPPDNSLYSLTSDLIWVGMDFFSEIKMQHEWDNLQRSHLTEVNWPQSNCLFNHWPSWYGKARQSLHQPSLSLSDRQRWLFIHQLIVLFHWIE